MGCIQSIMHQLEEEAMKQAEKREMLFARAIDEKYNFDTVITSLFGSAAVQEFNQLKDKSKRYQFLKGMLKNSHLHKPEQNMATL